MNELCEWCHKREATEEVVCLDATPRLFCTRCAPKAATLVRETLALRAAQAAREDAHEDCDCGHPACRHCGDGDFSAPRANR